MKYSINNYYKNVNLWKLSVLCILICKSFNVAKLSCICKQVIYWPREPLMTSPSSASTFTHVTSALCPVNVALGVGCSIPARDNTFITQRKSDNRHRRLIVVIITVILFCTFEQAGQSSMCDVLPLSPMMAWLREVNIHTITVQSLEPVTT